MRSAVVLGLLLAACKDRDGDESACVPTTEFCNSRDDDCDGFVDNNPQDGTLYFRDQDGDGAGDPQSPWRRCFPAIGWADSANGEDCDDRDGDVSPLEVDRCDGADQDCDGVADNDASTRVYFEDRDGDGHGDEERPVIACEEPEGVSEDALDCDDTDPEEWLDCSDLCPDCPVDITRFPEGVMPVAALDDADGDGFAELLVEDSGLRVLRGPHLPLHRADGADPPDVPGEYLCAEDFDADGLIDVAASSSTVAIAFAPYSGAPSDELTLAPRPPGSFTCGEFDEKPGADIVFADDAQQLDPCSANQMHARFWFGPGFGVVDQHEVVMAPQPFEGEPPIDPDPTDEEPPEPPVCPLQFLYVHSIRRELLPAMLVQVMHRAGAPSSVAMVTRGPFDDEPNLQWTELLAPFDPGEAILRVCPAVPRAPTACVVLENTAPPRFSARRSDLSLAFQYLGVWGADAFTVGDLYGDGRADFVGTDSVRRRIYVFDDPAGILNPNAPTYEIPYIFHGIVDILSEDFDGDGRDDLFVIENDPPGAVYVPGSALH